MTFKSQYEVSYSSLLVNRSYLAPFSHNTFVTDDDRQQPCQRVPGKSYMKYTHK